MGRVTVFNKSAIKFSRTFIESLDKLLSRVLCHGAHGKDREVAVTFVDDRAIRKLNREFRGLDKATDVLSFEMDEDGVLGDIIISVDTAIRNAKRFGVALEEEIRRLVVHGGLHLIGFDHMKAKDRLKMRKMEDKHLKIREG